MKTLNSNLLKSTLKIDLVSDPAWAEGLINMVRSWLELELSFYTVHIYSIPLQTAFRPSCMNRTSVFEWHKRFKEGRKTVRDDEMCGRSKEVNTPDLIGQSVRGEFTVTMLSFWGSSARDSWGRGQHSSNRVNGISTRTIHQSTTPSLLQTIRPRWAPRQFLTIPIVHTLLPVTFGYSLSSEALRQLKRWKRLWRRSLIRPHKSTSNEPS